MTVHDRWGPRAFMVRNPEMQASPVTVRDRRRSALEALMAAGDAGCTPIDHPAPRWAAYLNDLRGRGLEIETLTEPHAGPKASAGSATRRRQSSRAGARNRDSGSCERL